MGPRHSTTLEESPNVICFQTRWSGSDYWCEVATFQSGSIDFENPDQISKIEQSSSLVGVWDNADPLIANEITGSVIYTIWDHCSDVGDLNHCSSHNH
jgi:hypothetical protein